MRTLPVALMCLLVAACGGSTTAAAPPAPPPGPLVVAPTEQPASAPRAGMPGVVRTAPPGSLQGGALGSLQGAPPPPPGERLTKRQILEVMRAHQAEVRYCYERELVRAPSLAGTVVVRFVIRASGEVASAEVKSSTLGSPDVEECIRATVVKFVFPPPRGGGIVVVNYPYVLRTTEGAAP